MTVKTPKTIKVTKTNFQKARENFVDSSYDVKVDKIKYTKEGLEVFAQVWALKDIIVNGEDGTVRKIEAGTQIGFGKNGEVDIERFRIMNPPTQVKGKLLGKRTSKTGDESDVYELDYNPPLAVAQSLEHILKVKRQKFNDDKIEEGKVGNTTTTVYPNTGTGSAPIDGLLRKQALTGSFASGRGQTSGDAYASETSATCGRHIAHTSTDTFARFDRGSFGFPTASIPDGDTISSATFSLHVNTKANGLGEVGICLVEHTPASESALVSGDFNITTFGTTVLAPNLDTSAITTGQYNDWTLNAAGLAHINKTGNTIFGIISEWDRANSFGGTWVSGERSGLDSVDHADTGGTASDPKLVIEHSSTGPVTVTPTTETLTTSQDAVTVTTGVTLGSSPDTATTSEVAPTVVTEQSIIVTPSTETSTATLIQPGIIGDGNLTVVVNTPQEGTVTEVAPTVVVEAQVTVAVVTETGTVALITPTISTVDPDATVILEAEELTITHTGRAYARGYQEKYPSLGTTYSS